MADPEHGRDRPPNDDDAWADAPDRFEEADRDWAAKWAPPADESADEVERPGAGYRPTKATPGAVGDAYGDGMREAGPHLGFGMQIGAAMVFFVGVGIGVDRWLGTTPWGVVVGAVVGMAGVMALVVRFANESSPKKK